jgi:hypothetical protein
LLDRQDLIRRHSQKEPEFWRGIVIFEKYV